MGIRGAAPAAAIIIVIEQAQSALRERPGAGLAII